MTIIILSLAGGIVLSLTAILLCGKVYTDVCVRLGQRRFPALGEFIEIEGVKLHYVRKGKGPVVLLVHGAHGSIYDFQISSILEGLSPSYEVVAVDRPGFGYSGRAAKTQRTVFDHARVLHALVNALGLESPIIFGHSLGATIGLAYAQAYPDSLDKLFLVSAYVLPYRTPANPIHYIPLGIPGKIFMRTLFQPLVRAFVFGRMIRRVFDPQPVPDDYAEVVKALSLRPGQYTANAEDIRALGPGLFRLAESYDRICVPAMVVQGDADGVAPAHRHIGFLKQYFPQANVLLLKNAGHHPMFSHKEEILRAFERFVRSRPNL